MFGHSWANKQYFNPRWVSGLVLWLDGSDPAATGVLPSNGASVSSWVDKSTRGNNYSQGTGANQPVFNTNQINGKGALTFTAAKYLTGGTTGFPTGSGGRTMFVIYNTSSIATAQNFYIYGTVAADQYFGPLTIASTLWIDIDTHNTKSTTTTLANSTNYILEVNYPGTGLISTSAMWVNGVSQTVVPNSDGTPNTVLNNGWVATNAAGPGTFGVIGQLAEIIVYNTSLSATAQGNVRRYLANKWGISA